ncbi:arrestin domain-containing protein 3 [Ditylenchus destructor]|uniref:Arrestin domain-containing protein 3 n=1 Tax=Ditylenchus destructor TaxID=166010 RepID=A0AAD4MUY8_9BILA|nr:arrestin domain-containing protein 3 [Ditylenchus destructor]
MPGCKRPVAKMSVGLVPDSRIQKRRRAHSQEAPTIRLHSPPAEPVQPAAALPQSRDSRSLPSFTPPPRRRARYHSPERTNATFDHRAGGCMYASHSHSYSRNGRREYMGRIEIKFDAWHDPDIPTFYLAAPVKGRVEFYLKKPIQAISVTLHVYGTATNGWVYNRKWMYNLCSESFNQFNRELVLWERFLQRYTSPDGIIPAGQHSLPFSFSIPDHCPPTLELDLKKIKASVSYYLIAKIHRINPVDLKSKRTEFRVMANESSRGMAGILRSPGRGLEYPMTQKVTAKLGTCCYHDGTLRASIHLLNRPYIPGDKIKVCIKVVNSSLRTVKAIETSLLSQVKLTEKDGPVQIFLSKMECTLLQLRQRVNLGAYLSGVYEEEFFIPRDINPEIPPGSTLSLKYLLKVRILPNRAWLMSSRSIPTATFPLTITCPSLRSPAERPPPAYHQKLPTSVQLSRLSPQIATTSTQISANSPTSQPTSSFEEPPPAYTESAALTGPPKESQVPFPPFPPRYESFDDNS